MTLHYVPIFTQRRGSGKYVQDRAACGRWIDPETEHSVHPTCEQCRAYLEQQVGESEALAKQWDAENEKRT